MTTNKLPGWLTTTKFLMTLFIFIVIVVKCDETSSTDFNLRMPFCCESDDTDLCSELFDQSLNSTELAEELLTIGFQLLGKKETNFRLVYKNLSKCSSEINEIPPSLDLSDIKILENYTILIRDEIEISSTDYCVYSRYDEQGFKIHLCNLNDVVINNDVEMSTFDTTFSADYLEETTQSERDAIEVTKCCADDEVLDFSNYPTGPISCQLSGDKRWKPNIFETVRSRTPEEFDNVVLSPSHPREWCRSAPIILFLKEKYGDRRKLFKIVEDGKLWQKIDRRRWVELEEGNYCMDGSQNFQNDENSTILSGEFSGSRFDSVVVYCGKEAGTFKTRTSIVYGVAMIISSIFLLVTMIFYLLQWESHNVHGKTFFCYFTSMFMMYMTLGTVHFSSVTMDHQSSGTFCYIIAILAHFFTLQSYCWMTVVNFDIWLTFRVVLPISGRSKGRKRLFFYNLFSSAVPLTVIAVGLILTDKYKNDLESEVIIPDYGRTECFMEKVYAPLYYLYGPVGILLCSNLLFYCVTVYSMYKIQKSTKLASAASSRTRKHYHVMDCRGQLFLRLFFVMGIPWITEFIAWWIQPKNEEFPWYFVIPDLINIFQAIVIFFLFGLKAKAISTMEEKYPKFKRCTRALSFTPEEADVIKAKRPYLKYIVSFMTRSTDVDKSSSNQKTEYTETETRIQSCQKDINIHPNNSLPMKKF